MALQKETNFKGLTITDGYWRVGNFRFSEKTTCSFSMTLFPTADLALAEDSINNELTKFHYSFSYDLDSEDNLHTQAYNYVKTLDYFAGSLDV